MAKAKPQPDVDDRSQAQKQADDEATEFLGEEVRNGQVVNVPEEVAQPEAEPQPEPEAPKQEEQLPPPPPAIDPEKLKEELRAEVSQEIVNKLKPQEPAVDPEDISPWDREGRTPKDWNEVTEWASFQAMKKLNADIEADNQRAQSEAQAKADAEAQRLAAVNAQWDEEFDALRAAGKLPAMVDPNDQNDPGKQAQIALLQQMLTTNQERIAQGKQPVMSIAAFHNLYYKDPRQQPAGANAPVSLSRKSVSQPDPNQYSYQDIHNTPWEALEAQLKNS